jgi:polyisoprenoid-binding protein YceI
MFSLKKYSLLISAILFLTFNTAIAHASTYITDPPHTSIGFNVKYLMITDVFGQFNTYDAKVEIDETTKELIGVEANIEVASLTTENSKRDGHLKSPDFFDVTKFPSIIFKSKNVKKLGGNKYEVNGDLTIKGITKTITLKGEYTGFIDAGKMGGKRIGYTAEAIINRQDFDLNWNRELDQGGVLVGDEVVIELKIHAVAS